MLGNKGPIPICRLKIMDLNLLSHVFSTAFYQDANWVGPLVRLGNDAWLRRSIQVGITLRLPGQGLR